MFVINTGKAKGTTFKIKIKDLAFSSLFDTGAQVSCIKYDTVSELDRLHQISECSTCIRTANGQDVGVKGSILVSFQMGPCSFTHRFIMCKGITRPFILGEDFLSHHCFKLGWTDDNKRFVEYKEKHQPWASPIVVVPKKSAPGEAPRRRICVDFRKIYELQPKTQRVDKQTDNQGNLSLILLPKIDEMYANLCGAKIFTTLDLRSGYYHIALDKESKAKTAFVMPFGKYEFNAVPFGLV